MNKTKEDWLSLFREDAEKAFRETLKSKLSLNEKANLINRKIKTSRESYISEVLKNAQSHHWSNEQILNQILLLTYSSYVAMLEYRNDVWLYEYMSFARRIGELWEPFCKLPFYYPIKPLKIIEPPNSVEVQESIKQEANEFIDNLEIEEKTKNELKKKYSIPWTMVDSGGIQLALDLHFEQDGIHYNCDFKSGFSSNEKGNTNRLLLVASIYHYLSHKEKTLLFVRQEEDENNHYLQTLKNSPYWDVFCADKTYKAIYDFTGFNIRSWMDHNIDWKNDISEAFRKYLEEKDLIKYLSW